MTASGPHARLDVTPAPVTSQDTDAKHRILEVTCLAMLYAVPLTVTWTVAGVHIALGIAAASGVALGLLRRHWPLVRTPADGAFVAFAVASCLAAIFAHPSASSIVPLKKLLLIPLVHLAAAVLARPHRARAALRLLVFAAAATALVSSTVFLTQVQDETARLRSTTHYMTWSGLLLLALPMSAVAAFRAPSRWRLAYAAATVFLSLAIALTQTRSAWLGIAVAAVAILARVRARLVWFVPVTIVLIALVAPSEYQARLRQTFDLQHGATTDRFDAWGAGWKMWRAHPLTGVGLGDLQPLYRQNAPDAPRAHGHLHNNWIQILASMGVIGLVAFGWLMLRFGQIVWNATRATQRTHPELHGLAMGAWGSFWGFQVMGLFEWNFGDVEVTITLYFLMGSLLAVTACAREHAQRV